MNRQQFISLLSPHGFFHYLDRNFFHHLDDTDVIIDIPEELHSDSTYVYEHRDTLCFLYSLEITATKPNGTKVITLKKNEDAKVAQLVAEYKNYLIRYVHHNGIVLENYTGTFTYAFRGTNYLFDIDDLKVFDLFGYPSEGNMCRQDYITPHILELCQIGIRVPCKDLDNGIYTIVELKHKFATDVFKRYCQERDKYVTNLNTITTFIHEFQPDLTTDGFTPLIEGLNSETDVSPRVNFL